MDQNAALTASPREGDTTIIKTELVRSMSVAEDVRDGTHLRTADRTLALTSLMKQENQLTAGAEELLRLLGRTQAQQEDENQIRKQIDVVRPAVDQPRPSKDSPPTAPVQEIRKLKELELLMDVQRVIATTDEQRKSLESMGIDVEKCLTGGGLVKAISPVLLLATPHWMSRIGEVLTNRMKTELAQGDEQMQGGVPQAEAGGAAAPEGQGDEEEAPAQVLAQLLLLAVARTAAGPKCVGTGRAAAAPASPQTPPAAAAACPAGTRAPRHPPLSDAQARWLSARSSTPRGRRTRTSCATSACGCGTGGCAPPVCRSSSRRRSGSALARRRAPCCSRARRRC